MSGIVAHQSNPPLNKVEHIFAEILDSYSKSPIFSTPQSFVMASNPYRRPIRPQDIKALDFHQPLSRADVTGPSALVAQRILLNIYESDLIFLPEDNFEQLALDFRAFYADDLKVCGEIIRPILERHLFAFLNDEVDVAGTWTFDKLKFFCGARIEAVRFGDGALIGAIRSAKDPRAAGRLFLVQCAGDFLTEASAMARNLLGNYGQELSELFKIFIDEYGYGVHAAKHSTIFETLLRSVGMSPHPHYYWQFYLASSGPSTIPRPPWRTPPPRCRKCYAKCSARTSTRAISTSITISTTTTAEWRSTGSSSRSSRGAGPA
jgi:hypothetical protein